MKSPRLVRLAAAAAVVTVAALLPSAALAAGPPAPSASPPAAAGSQAPAPAGAGSKLPGRHATRCEATAAGKVSDCPALPSSVHVPAAASDKNPVTSAQAADPASLVDTRTWTTGGGNTFPGAEAPFGMVQWSPDTMPSYNAGGGYGYGDESLWGYSLTHVSGPGCGAGGDVPILPMTGGLPSGTPSQHTTSFTNSGEVAQAGYYSAQSNGPDPITSAFTATPHSSMGQFTFPSTTAADFLVKLDASQNGDAATSATVVGNNELQGSVTSGDFCGESDNDGQSQLYTVYFDIVFSQPFTASQVVPGPAGTGPDSAFLTFDTTKNQTVDAKVGISYVSAAGAKANWQAENPGWDFSSVRKSAQSSWNSLLSRIKVGGGSVSQTQEFYSLLYKDFLQPNITSDVNGQFMGADDKVHTVAKGQSDQYGIFSGWDIYHSLSQLQAMLDPSAASDEATSQLNYYAENKLLQQWGYLQDDNYVMVGDPVAAIIPDFYSFGARGFDTKTALKDMLAQADTTNDVRPEEAAEQKYGYIPEDGAYGCCNAHGFVSSLLEYDTEDFALSQFASGLGDSSDAAALRDRANNWVNVFDSATGLLTPRKSDGSFEPGVGPADTAPYVEGDAYEYLWNVPNDYAGLFSLLGGSSQVAPELRQYLSEPNGFGMYAQMTNEFDEGEQNALDYAGDPAGTQAAVNTIRNGLYLPGPAGLPNNDDLGANSSQFVWEMLGLYPENPGSDTLLLNSPGFPSATITLPSGKKISISAPGASPSKYYADSLKIDGQPDSKLYTTFSALRSGASLDWALGTKPTSWGSAPADAPPSYGPTFADSVSASQGTLDVQPGKSATTTITVRSSSGSAQTVNWSAAAPSGVSISPSSGSLSVPAGGSASVPVTVTGGSSDGNYAIPVTFTTSAGTVLPLQLSVVVDTPGDLAPYYNISGISSDGSPTAANYDGDGYSYSQQALAAAGLSPGGTDTVGGITYTWPDTQAGQPDAIGTAGQTIPVNAPAGSSAIGFIGSAVNAGTTPSTGTVTVTYTDGSTSAGTLTMTDWTLGGGGGSVASGDTVAAKTPYRDYNGGSQQIGTYLFANSVSVDSSKTVSSVTLPATADNGSIAVFAIAAG